MVSRSLCFDADLSPPPETGDDDFNDVFFSSSSPWVNEDSRDSGYGSPNNQVLSPSPKRIYHNARRSLFSRKRLRDDDVEADVVPKRRRLPAATCDVHSDIIQRLEGEGHLIGDGSQNHSLPTVCGSKPDIASISSTTLSELIDGMYEDDISSFQIIDCRYPYEFEGGRIKGAMNVYRPEDVNSLLRSQSREELSRDKKKVLVFHCEFFSQPWALRYLRNADRQLNSDQYPKLFFPEIYLLSGGYKSFFTQCQNYCTPVDYVPMLDRTHAGYLRHFRSRSKSWTAGQSRRRVDQLQTLSNVIW
ncbi:M-phase inducer phosphatase-like [Gigantopelta aegis]|uniref:M-phase inducer phosphatase-like n=1 Tax=Gigantopelta aegis TaxID=1735272 RepID=UPI001B88A462|nr:M-phase inducer phosphatase-like [Gigantopelta aegis]